MRHETALSRSKYKPCNVAWQSKIEWILKYVSWHQLTRGDRMLLEATLQIIEPFSFFGRDRVVSIGLMGYHFTRNHYTVINTTRGIPHWGLGLKARAWNSSSPGSRKPSLSWGFQAEPGPHITNERTRLLRQGRQWATVRCVPVTFFF